VRWILSTIGLLIITGITLAQGPGSTFRGPFSDMSPIVHAPSANRTISEITLTQGGNLPQATATDPANAGSEGGGGGDNGTNPAQNATTFIVSNEYYTLEGGNRINTTYARFKYPWYDQRGSLLFEVPFVYYNFQSSFPNVPQVGGLGDIRIQGSYNTWTSCDNRLTMINFLEVFLPSSDNAVLGQNLNGNELTAFNLGTGKYVVGPGIGFVYAFKPNFIIAPLYFYEASVFGNSNRPSIRRGKFRLFGMYAWSNGIYALPEFQALTNYLTGNNDFYVAPEIGYSHKGTTAYVKPGVGIDPDANDRKWGFELGFRILY
jgi:hypothetical protein